MKTKLSAISQLIELAKVDGDLHTEEIKFIHSIGRQLGVSDEKLLELMKNPAPFCSF